MDTEEKILNILKKEMHSKHKISSAILPNLNRWTYTVLNAGKGFEAEIDFCLLLPSGVLMGGLRKY